MILILRRTRASRHQAPIIAAPSRSSAPISHCALRLQVWICYFY